MSFFRVLGVIGGYTIRFDVGQRVGLGLAFHLNFILLLYKCVHYKVG